MSGLLGTSVAEFNERTKAVLSVVAKTRKKCHGCGKMVERGENAVLTDDRYADYHVGRMSGAMRSVVRGAWHLWHPACHIAEDK